MKKIGMSAFCLWSLLVIALLMPGVSAAEYGTMSKCVSGCLPGVNSCSKCCDSTFGKVQGPCESSCQNDLTRCSRKCTDQFEECSAAKRTDCPALYKQCKSECRQSFNSCDNNCGGIQASFDCPNWMDPNQKCPYDCQVWNPASRSCVGAPMNGCK